MSASRQKFLETYDTENAKTARLLRGFPADKVDEKLHPNVKTARELAFTFVLERYLGKKVWHDEFAKAGPSGNPPKPPEKWDDILAAFASSSAEWRELIASAPEGDLTQTVKFFVGPKTMGDIPRIDWAWFLLHDEIHHRGQFTILTRMAGGKVPSIFGPSESEPWF